MASLPFVVTAGKPPQSFPRQLDIGTTLVNTGTVDVWVSDNPGMVSGIGMPLRATGSLEITTAGNYWVVMDASATAGATVTVIVSSDVTGYTDPVAVATATATAILATGVPLVLSVENIRVNLNVPPGGSLPIDVSRYGSLYLSDNSAATVAASSIGLIFADITGTLVIKEYVWGKGPTTIAGPLGGLSTPVYGPFLYLYNNDAVAHTITIEGSNRVTTQVESLYGSNVGGPLVGVTPGTVAGTDYVLGSGSRLWAWNNQRPTTVNIVYVGTTSQGTFVLKGAVGGEILVGDTNNILTGPGGTVYYVTKTQYFPLDLMEMVFRCAVGGSPLQYNVTIS